LKPHILLLSGPLSVGKSSVARVLTDEFHFTRISSSDFLRGILAERRIPTTRQALQDLGDALDRETDFKWLIDAVARKHIEEDPDQAFWYVDAVRKPQQVVLFRSTFRQVLHVHLTAEEDVLASRFAARARDGDFAGDMGSYARATESENEQAARALLHIADAVIDLGITPPHEAAANIMRSL
jgi:adenylate kinase family enzyme